ncbi:protein phosphatase 2C-like domain-containing protein 1 isoform X2 [Lineus longissimus]|uniref:protein phosphatase 2C-like domain-containing protein 1 isoform X2 n=1 Tax=Lineus longissimus TaxID=88925 RepID=UPI002B4E8656
MEQQEVQVAPELYGGNQVNNDIESEFKVESRKPSSIYLHKNEPRISEVPGFIRPDTPETVITEYPTNPDLSLYCEKCQLHIALHQLKEHRFLHKALQALRYKGTNKPETLDALIKRRRFVLKQMRKGTTSEKPLDSTEVQRLNEAYEYMKSLIENTYEQNRRIYERINTDVEGVGLNCSPACVLGLGMCSSQNERFKCEMEDTRVFQDYFGNDRNKSFFGVYDGHNGYFAAEVASNELHHILLKEMSRFDPMTSCTCAVNMIRNSVMSDYDMNRPSTRNSERVKLHDVSANMIHQILHTCEENMDNLNEVEMSLEQIEKYQRKHKTPEKDPFSEKMQSAFYKSYAVVDHLLTYGMDEHSRVRWSGCSGLSVVIQNTAKTESLDDQEDDRGTNYDDTDSVSSGHPAPKEMGVIHLANAGNVRVVLVRDNKPYRMSRDHTPYSPKEKARVIKAGGYISESEKDLKVNGILSATRGLGNHGDPKLKKCIPCEPYTRSIPIDQYAQFLILATKGVWEVFTDEEAAILLYQMLPNNRLSPSPSKISNSLQALLAEYNSQLSQTLRPESGTSQGLASAASYYSVGPHHSAQPGGEDGKENVNNENDSEMKQTAPTGGNMKHRPDTGKSVASHVSFAKEDRVMSPNADLKTEVGSQVLDIYDEGGDSGNEGDIETSTDYLSFGGMLSRASEYPLTREVIQREFAKAMSEKLVQAALLAGAKDNITVMVILLPGCGL